MTASTCNDGDPATGSADYDTKINVYCPDCDLLTCVAGQDDNLAECADFTTKLSWCSEAGRPYQILVQGFFGETGNFELGVFDDGTPCEGAVPCDGDIGGRVCGQLQANVQDDVGDEDPETYRNHGHYVRSVARQVSHFTDEGIITEECSSCIVSQFARRVPVAEQEPCSCGGGTCDPGLETGRNCAADCPSCSDRPDLCGIGAVPNGNCWCDQLCDDIGDCCEDVCAACPDLSFCGP